MNFKLNKTKFGGTDKVLKNMQKITGTDTGDGIEDRIETGLGELEVSNYLGKVQTESKGVAKDIVGKLNATGKSTRKKLSKKVAGDAIAFRKR